MYSFSQFFLICTISLDIHWNKLFKTFASDLFKGSLVISFCLFFSQFFESFEFCASFDHVHSSNSFWSQPPSLPRATWCAFFMTSRAICAAHVFSGMWSSTGSHQCIPGLLRLLAENVPPIPSSQHSAMPSKARQGTVC